MMTGTELDRKKHWENIYESKDTTCVSWFREFPELSLQLIEKYTTDTNAKIIDVGAGDGRLVDYLLDRAYKNLTVLDISQKAIDTVNERLGDKGNSINWLVSDVCELKPSEKYDIWHDRAVFHFLNKDSDIGKYLEHLSNSLNKGSYLIISSFSMTGPIKCSGIDVRQYSTESLQELFGHKFELIESFYKDHTTPSGSDQNFVWAVFRMR